MTTPGQFIVAVACGGMLIGLGFYPGPLYRVMQAIQDFGGLFLTRVPNRHFVPATRERSWWLVGLGVVLIALAVAS